MKTKYDTLVLNRLWAPIHIIDWKKTVNLMYQEIAQGLDNDFLVYHSFNDWLEHSKKPEVLDGDYMFVNSPNIKICVPDIVVLRQYDKFNVRDIKYSRENVFARDKFICQYCGHQFKRDDLTIDHVIPKSLGGTNKWTNVVACCKPCNHKKADQLLAKAGMKLLHKPTEPKWKTPLGKAVDSVGCRHAWKKFMKSIDTES